VPKQSLLSALLDYAGYVKKDRITAAYGVTDDRFLYSDDVDVAMGTKQWDRTLDSGNIAKINKEMWIAYKTNPLIFFTVELAIRMIIGSEASIFATGLESDKPEEVKAGEILQEYALDPFWKSPANNWTSLMPDTGRDLVLFGEVIPIPYVNTLTGDTVMGFLPPESVKHMVRDALNARRVTAIIVADDNNQEITLPVVSIDNGGLSKILKPTKDIYSSAPNDTTGRLTGRCFYWAINRALTSARGSGDFV